MAEQGGLSVYERMSEGQTIFRTHKTEWDRFTPVLNETIRDNRVSFKATGLLIYLLSLPPNWKATQGHLATCKTDKRDSVISGWNELREHNYITKEVIREKGKIIGTIWHIYESPFTDLPETAEPKPANPVLQKKEGDEKQSKQKSPPAPVDGNGASSIESKLTEIHLPPELDSDEFVAAWDDWIAFRRERKIRAYQPRGAKVQLLILAEMGQTRAIAAIQYSIAQQYQGIYEAPKSKTTATRTDRNAGTFNADTAGSYAGVEKLAAGRKGS